MTTAPLRGTSEALPDTLPASHHLGNPASSSTAAARRRVERSCVLCHRRKVKCDKRLPCGTCSRTNVLCCYPSGDKTAPRKEKTTISDIASRLVQLERTIVAISSSGDDQPRGPRSPASPAQCGTGLQVYPEDGMIEVDDRTDSLSTTSSRRNAPGEEILVNDGQYINEVLLSKVLEEEQDIHQVLATPKYTANSDSGVSEVGTPLPSFGLLALSQNAHLSSSTTSHDLHPEKWQCLQLWNIYVQNVDTMSKILHIPSAQVTVFTALNNLEQAPPDVICLLFSIYFCAVTSLLPEEVFSILGQRKSAAQDQFRTGLEQALVAADILDAPSLTTLQALAMFLQANRAKNTSRSAWILNGLAIRAAQSVGMHRDGSRFHLRPFETEMRRRLWWHLMSHDGRAAEDHGLAVSSHLLDFTTDTRFPLNVDDCALDPAMTEFPPEPKGRWTEMTLSAIMYLCNMGIQRSYKLLPSVAAEHSVADLDALEAARLEVIGQLKSRVEALLAVCNPVIPQQRATIFMGRSVFQKLEFISRQQWLNVRLGLEGVAVTPKDKKQQREAFATDENLMSACDILELNHRTLNDDLLRNYRWTSMTYPQTHILLYVLWHLCIRPTGPSIERAWKLVSVSFELEEKRRINNDGEVKGASSKWTVLTYLRDKALRVRESLKLPAEERRSTAQTSLTGEPELQEQVPPDGEMLDLNGVLVPDDMLWEQGFGIWDAVVDDLGVRSHEFGGPGSGPAA